MEPSRILPDLQCALLCEQVRREANGNFFLIGVLDGLVLPQFPVALPGLCLFARWTSGIGEFTCTVRLMAPDQTNLIQKGEVKFGMKDPNRNSTTVLLLQQPQFKEPGTYFVEVMVDDVMKVRFPLPVVPVPQQAQNPNQRLPPRPNDSFLPVFLMSQGRPERAITDVDGAQAHRCPPAWQPLTFRGVAAFGHATGNRLMVVQFVIVLLLALALLHFFLKAILPNIWIAVENLPEQGYIQDQVLIMDYPSTEPLVESRILGFVIDLDDQSQDILSSDFQFEVQRRHWQICSLPGCATFDYPDQWIIQLNRREVASTIEAWAPILLGTTVLAVILFFFLMWSLLALSYAFIPWLLAFYSNRSLSFMGAFRLSAAAQLPGGLLLALALLCYAMDWIGLIRLVILVIAHLPLTWVFLLTSPFFLPLIEEAQSGPNPFNTSAPEDEGDSSPKSKPTVNPNPFVTPDSEPK